MADSNGASDGAAETTDAVSSAAPPRTSMDGAEDGLDVGSFYSFMSEEDRGAELEPQEYSFEGSTVTDLFELYRERVKAAKNNASHTDLLELYSLYKQATVGDISGSKPEVFDAKGRAKFDAWTGKKGLKREDAKLQYVEAARRVLGESGAEDTSAQQAALVRRSDSQRELAIVGLQESGLNVDTSQASPLRVAEATVRSRSGSPATQPGDFSAGATEPRQHATAGTRSSSPATEPGGFSADREQQIKDPVNGLDWGPRAAITSAPRSPIEHFDIATEGEVPAGSTLSLYDVSWDRASSSSYELRLQVVSAYALKAPEYRVGDLSTSFFKGATSLFNAVYVECELAGRKVKTDFASNLEGTDSVSCSWERAVLLFSLPEGAFEQTTLEVSVKDHRKVGGVLRGDPLIGKAVLPLEADLQDCLLRQIDLPIQRGGVDKGTVLLHYQVLAVTGGAVAT